MPDKDDYADIKRSYPNHPHCVVIRGYQPTLATYAEWDGWIEEQGFKAPEQMLDEYVNRDTLLFFKDPNLAFLFRVRWL